MKNLKLSVLSLLSAATLTFSSCLDDGDNTVYYGGMGTCSGLGGYITMDATGIRVIPTNASLTDYDGDRLFVYGAVNNEENVDLSTLQAGDKITVLPSMMDKLYDSEDLLNAEDELKAYDLSDVESLAWCQYGGFSGNGYLNLQFSSDIVLQTVTGTDNKTTETVVIPELYAYPEVSEDGKTVTLVLGCDNRVAEFTEEKDGAIKWKEGYSDGGTRMLGYSIDLSDVYHELIAKGKQDSENISFSIYVAEKGNDGSIDRGSQRLSASSLSVLAFKRQFGSY